MSYTYHIIFSLLCTCNIILPMSMDFAPKTKSPKPINMQPINMADMPEEIRESLKKELQEQHVTKKENSFSEEEIKEMELVFEHSPQDAQCIVDYLQDPTYFPGVEGWRAAFFVGNTGTGKTMMAKAIAYKMSQEGWDYRFRTSPSFLGEYRNQTATNLQIELNNIAASNKPTILIIDEVGLLLKHTESKYHDTSATSSVLFAFLEKHKYNKNFFFIGTVQLDDAKKFSKTTKSRILGDIVLFEPLN